MRTLTLAMEVGSLEVGKIYNYLFSLVTTLLIHLLVSCVLALVSCYFVLATLYLVQ